MKSLLLLSVSLFAFSALAGVSYKSTREEIRLLCDAAEGYFLERGAESDSAIEVAHTKCLKVNGTTKFVPSSTTTSISADVPMVGQKGSSSSFTCVAKFQSHDFILTRLSCTPKK